MRRWREFLASERAATAIEYSLIGALVAIAAFVAMQGLGSELRSSFESTSSALKNA